MSPAPGPSSSPGTEAGSLLASAAAPNSGATASLQDMQLDRDDSSQAGPKTCLRCGRHLEASEVLPPGEASIRAAAGPSPSSVAFAAEPSTSSQISSILFAGNASSSSSDATAMDEDRHHICTACLARDSLTTAPAPEVDVLLPRSGSRDRRIWTSTLRQQMQNNTDQSVDDPGAAATTAQTQTQTEDRPVESTREAAAAAASTSSTNNNRPPRDISAAPWRRAPWARTSSSEAINSSVVPLSLSLSNIGAGGDAEMQSADNESEFPPLARSPHAPLQSPRLPVSPSRMRGTTSPPTSPTIMGRHPSFSRSQSGTIVAPIPTSPIVNFPSRGRNRAGSASSNSSSAAVGSVPAVPHHTRRPSAHRRLSRSSSSQGVKVVPIVESNTSTMEGEKIEEDPYGPSSMTRPRLSTQTSLQIASKNTPSSSTLRDAHDRRVKDKNGQEGQGSKNDSEEKPTWFRYDRPDPRRDISKLRCTSRGRGCLFPGAIFNGTQKSGRMSYDVTVQIVNVDMATSHLCGYLNIRGLTDDWPELTTYFDAEIIGQRYGFLTGKWGATEADDMKHWSRFPPFRPLKNSLIKPGLRFNHMNKPFIFMRWKERFLVPDHRVRDINGASFAGFYYVCVELGEEEPGPVTSPTSLPLSPSLSNQTIVPPTTAAAATTTALATATATVVSPASSTVVPSTASTVQSGVAPIFTRQRSASNRRRMTSAGAALPLTLPGSWTEESREGEAGGEATQGGETGTETDQAALASMADPPAITGRMSGFYFHEHSEPYQQLTLQHVAERSSSTFELR